MQFRELFPLRNFTINSSRKFHISKNSHNFIMTVIRTYIWHLLVVKEEQKKTPRIWAASFVPPRKRCKNTTFNFGFIVHFENVTIEL